MLHPRTLQQRLFLFMLLPISLLLFGVGAFGFMTMRTIFLSQWEDATIGRLERAAHRVDMKLSQPKDLIQMYHRAAGSPQGRAVQDWIVQQLRSLEGVADVRTTWEGAPADALPTLVCDPPSPTDGRHPTGEHAAGFAPCRLEITTPRYDASSECDTVSVHSDFKSPDGSIIGKIEVHVRLDYLLAGAVPSQNEEGFKVYLIDDCGEVILSSTGERTGQTFDGSSLESATLEASRTRHYGTVMGEGRPPSEVSGFYRLHEAPWSFVVVAPGRVIMGTLVTFRNYYFGVGGGMILLIVLLIRSTAGRTVSTIQEVSQAADRVAGGDLEVLVHSAEGRRDELSRLIASFNSMVAQLQERLRLKEAVNLAQEVQQSLLPHHVPSVSGLDLAGRSEYCDETGGDYFDFIRPFGRGSQSIYVAVGDVVGHGLGAALLMTTVRALLRGRLAMPGKLTEVVTDVNRLLCQDMDRTVTFMTLFIARIDPARREIRWVRAGHDPGLLYDPLRDAFLELQGGGPALGIDSAFVYEEGSRTDLSEGQILVLATDGIWETENASMEQFGKDSLRDVVRRHRRLSASGLVEAILRELDDFRGTAARSDDATIVAARVGRT